MSTINPSGMPQPQTLHTITNKVAKKNSSAASTPTKDQFVSGNNIPDEAKLGKNMVTLKWLEPVTKKVELGTCPKDVKDFHSELSAEEIINKPWFDSSEEYTITAKNPVETKDGVLMKKVTKTFSGDGSIMDISWKNCKIYKTVYKGFDADIKKNEPKHFHGRNWHDVEIGFNPKMGKKAIGEYSVPSVKFTNEFYDPNK